MYIELTRPLTYHRNLTAAAAAVSEGAEPTLAEDAEEGGAGVDEKGDVAEPEVAAEEEKSTGKKKKNTFQPEEPFVFLQSDEIFNAIKYAC